MCPLSQCPATCSLSSTGDFTLAFRDSVQWSTLCMSLRMEIIIHKRHKMDYVRNSLQICTFSRPSWFVLQNHIMFCSSSVTVWFWSWICERLGSKSAVFTNIGGMSAKHDQIQIWSLRRSKWLVTCPQNWTMVSGNARCFLNSEFYIVSPDQAIHLLFSCWQACPFLMPECLPNI